MEFADFLATRQQSTDLRQFADSPYGANNNESDGQPEPVTGFAYCGGDYAIEELPDAGYRVFIQFEQNFPDLASAELELFYYYGRNVGITVDLNLFERLEMACRQSDLDAACRYIQDGLGVDSGDVAGIFFSYCEGSDGPNATNWRDGSLRTRFEWMRDYIRSETSWHNDVCPSFEAIEGLRIWVDHADPALSEWGADRSARFSVIDYRDDDNSNGLDLYGGDDWKAVLWTVALHEPIATRAAAERFIEALHAAGLSYHFDDGAIDCLHRNGLLSIDDARRVDQQIVDCYAAWEASGADLAHDCPIGHALKVMDAAGELPKGRARLNSDTADASAM
jgi:hypothetical protein